MRKLIRRWLANPKTQGGLRGSIDGLFASRMDGWAFYRAGHRVRVTLRKNGTRIAQGLASLPRSDLAALGLGDGAHGFSMEIAPEVEFERNDVVEVMDDDDASRKVSLRLDARVFNSSLGQVESLAPGAVTGWAYFPWQPQRRCTLEVLVAGSRHAQGRADVIHERLPWGRGPYGFRIGLKLDKSAPPSDISVRCIESGQALSMAFSGWTSDEASPQPAPGSETPGVRPGRAPQALLDSMDALLAVYRDETEARLAALNRRIADLEEGLTAGERHKAAGTRSPT